MTDSPPNKRFQIHLSTAIVMMFVAGALIWANVHERGENIQRYASNYGYSVSGWPFIAVRTGVKFNGSLDVDFVNQMGERQWRYSMVFIDVAVAIASVAIAWFLFEWLIRRRAASR